jgi:hypothetical protein
MSRSNHNYYNLRSEESDECFLIARQGQYVQRAFATRRGLVRRGKRFPCWSIKSWHRGPDKWWKRMWHKKARTVQRFEMFADPEVPVITPMRRLVDMWDWY